jgi:hypothetical protein
MTAAILSEREEDQQSRKGRYPQVPHERILRFPQNPQISKNLFPGAPDTRKATGALVRDPGRPLLDRVRVRGHAVP